MRRALVLVFLFFCSRASFAQEFKFDVSYQYLYAKQWDKVIQGYNFSRPSIANQQSLLNHGFNTSLSYIFTSQKNLKHGINLGYAYFGSSADNRNFQNKLNLHFINLAYLMHLENEAKMKGLYFDLIFGVKASGLFRNLNGEDFLYDDIWSKAFGIGADLGLKMGYKIQLKSGHALAPFVAFTFSPAFYAPNTEVVINQTRTLLSKNYTGVLNSQLGVVYILSKR